MKFFNDATGKQWQIDINLGTIERVKALREVDLTKLFDEDCKLLAELSDNYQLLAEVLWDICGKGGDKQSFLASLKGDSLELAAKALVDDVIDFFPNSRRRKLCRDLVAKIWETVDASQDQAEQAIQGIDPKLLISAGG